jgi:hypothetical protein
MADCAARDAAMPHGACKPTLSSASSFVQRPPAFFPAAVLLAPRTAVMTGTSSLSGMNAFDTALLIYYSDFARFKFIRT